MLSRLPCLAIAAPLIKRFLGSRPALHAAAGWHLQMPATRARPAGGVQPAEGTAAQPQSQPVATSRARGRRATPATAATGHPPAASPPPSEPAGQQPSPAAAAEASPASARKHRKPRAAAAPSLDPAQLESVRAKALRIAEVLQRLYPDPPIPLDHASHFQLLSAVLLSAQTTDKKVNECTPALFALAPDAAAMAALDVAAIEGCIRQLGLAPTKAKNLKAMAQMLLDRHGGEVPDTFEALEALPGVGHKTASVVMAQAFGRAAFPVDTHIHRLAQRWGLTAGASVEQTEADLKLAFPEHMWRQLHLQIIFLGREHCPARGHDPSACPVCAWAGVPGASPLKPGQRPAARGSPAGGGKAGSAKAARAGSGGAAPKRAAGGKAGQAAKRVRNAE